MASTAKQDDRRNRGEIACRECRRLKVKCDRTIPCGSCVKRGCAALCPNGIIPPGDGSRFVFAAEEHIRAETTRLEQRMHALEDALAILQSVDSTEPHPLLAQPTTFDEEPPEDHRDGDHRLKEESEEPTLKDAFGALHIDDANGASMFFGPSGGSESLLWEKSDVERPPSTTDGRPTLEEIDPSYFPHEINILYDSFPLATTFKPTESVQASIESFLPSIARATMLCETLLENLTWMFSICSRKHLIDELIPAIYNRDRAEPRTYGPHDLALLLICLGIGALVDLTQPPYALEAQHYYRLARAAANLESVLAHRSIVSVKVVHLMSIYNGMSGKEDALEMCYTLLNLAGQMALGIGLHMDPSLWSISGAEGYERRSYFWNLLQPSLWQALVVGRPPVFMAEFLDCHVPTALEGSLIDPISARDVYNTLTEHFYHDGKVPLGFGVWSSHFSMECLLPVVKVTMSAVPPSYQSILALDEKIRNFNIPVAMDPIANEPEKTETATSSMQSFVRSHYRELALLFLHRGFFAQALMDNVDNPFEGPHSQSFFTAYYSACTILDSTISSYGSHPVLTPRIWRIWSNAFSSSVIIGTVAIRTPNARLDPPPFVQLGKACQLFQAAARVSSRANRALPILLKMYAKAQKARQLPPDAVLDADSEPFDELAIFGGKTHFVVSHSQTDKSGSRPVAAPETLQVPVPPAAKAPLADLDSQQLDDFISQLSTFPPPSTYDNTQLEGDDDQVNWESLYRELPSHPAQNFEMDLAFPDLGSGNNGAGGGGGIGSQTVAPQSGAMLEDRWATFMNNYDFVMPPQNDNVAY